MADRGYRWMLNAFENSTIAPRNLAIGIGPACKVILNSVELTAIYSLTMMSSEMTSNKIAFLVKAIALLVASSQTTSAEYTPSWSARAASRIPHVTYKLETSSNMWKIQSDTLNTKNNYVQSLITLPAILLAIGILLFLFLLLFWLLRYAGCMCFADRPSNSLLIRDPLAWVRAVRVRKNTLLGVFTTFFVLTLAAATLSWYGYTLLIDGISGTQTDMRSAGYVFQGMRDNGDSIESLAGAAVASLSASVCAQSKPSYPTALSEGATLASVSGSVSTALNNVYPKLFDLSTLLGTYGVVQYRIAVAVFFGLIAAVCIMLAIGVAIRHKTLVIANVSIGLAVFIVLFVLCSVTMVAITGLGDFCLSPTEHLISSLPLNSYVSQYASYYFTCASTDPLSTPVTDMTTSMNGLRAAVEQILAACPSDTNVIAAANSADAVTAVLNTLRNAKTCQPIQTSLLSGLNDGLCANVYSGFFGVWLAFFVSLPCLYVVLATSAVIYEYFNIKYWGAAEANAHLLTWQTVPKEKDADTETGSLPPQTDDPRINELSVETGTKEM